MVTNIKGLVFSSNLKVKCFLVYSTHFMASETHLTLFIFLSFFDLIAL